MFLDRRGQAQHAHDLVHAGSREPLPSGNVGLVGDLAGLQEGLPFDGLAEELDAVFGLYRSKIVEAISDGLGAMSQKDFILPKSGKIVSTPPVKDHSIRLQAAALASKILKLTDGRWRAGDGDRDNVRGSESFTLARLGGLRSRQSPGHHPRYG